MSVFEYHTFSLISESFRIFSIWPLIVQVFQMLIQSEASLSVRLLTNLQLPYKHNSDTEPEVSFLNIYAYKCNTFGWTHKLTFKKRASYIWDGRTATLQMLHFIYFFSTNINTEYFKHARHCLFFYSKCHLLHNATFFGSCIIHILHTGVLKFKCKTPVPKGSWSTLRCSFT